MFNKKIGLFGKLLTYIPLSYNGIVKNVVGNDFKTILDVGCGTGIPMEIINMNGKLSATGADLYEPYLKECSAKDIYKKLIKADVRNLPFKEKSFDVVICFHVIEHLTKKEGKTLIRHLENIARKRVVLAMPVGHLRQEEYDDNEHQEHKSEWYPQDLEKLGYKVIGQGLKALYKEDNVVEKYGIFSNFFFLISMLLQPILFLIPQNAVYMFCMKTVND